MGEKRTFLALALALATAACGSGASPSAVDPEWTNGSRLRAVLYQTEDGAKQQIAWHDTQRNEDCYFARTADGGLHCLPDEAAFADIFADAACAQPMMGAWTQCPAPPYAWHIEAPCDTGYTLHRRGALLSPKPAAYYFRDYDGSCVGGTPTEPDVDYYALEAAEDLSAFVAADLTQEANGPVNDERLIADDGARQLTGAAYDPASGARVSIAYTGGSEVPRWTPDMYSGSYYSDGACIDQIGCDQAVDSCATARTLAPFVAHSEYDDTCGQWQVSYYEGGDAAVERSWDDGTACTAVTPSLTCVAAGEPIPPEAFAAHTWSDLGSGRIRARHDAIEGGGAVGPVWFYFHDTELDVDCYPLTAIDGSLRCLPSFFVPYANLFEDLSCTIPAAYRHEPSTDETCWPTPPVPELATWREPDTTPCAGGHFSDAPRRTYRVGEVMPQSEALDLFTSDTGVCQPYDPATFPGEVHRITEMAPEEFVPVDQVVE